MCFICSLQAVVAAEVSTENTNKNVTSTSPAEVAVVANNDLLSYSPSQDNETLGIGGQSFTELNQTINSGQAVIDLENNYTFRDSDTRFVNGIRIDRPITIYGNGFAIDGANKARIFDIYAPVTLNNIVFINGNSSTNGGAIDVEDAFASRIDLCTFINNSAKDSGGAIYLNDMANDTVVTDCKFINNTADINGGAIEWHKDSINGLVTNSEFTNNIAGRSGGAIYWNGYNGTVRNSKFNGNKALGINNDTDSYGKVTYGGDGGAIIWIGALGEVKNSTFKNNNASKRGGAAFLEGGTNIDCDDTTFDNCTFISNYAGTNGGAVDWHEGASNGNVLNCVFEDNAANANGGAIYWRGHNGEVRNSNFTNNTAKGLNLGTYNNTGDGGAVFWAGVNGTLINDRFISNKAIKNINNNTSGRGGAMYAGSSEHGNRNITITGSYFKDNNAGTNGGALDWYYGARDGLVDDCTFVHNIANRSGGAIFWNGYNGTVKNSKFNDNYALGIANATNPYGEITLGGDGGAIIWIGSLGDVKNSTFKNNNASKRGGAVFIEGGTNIDCNDTTFDNCTFISNYAGTNGGAVDWHEGASNGNVLNCVFEFNAANANGGAIYWRGHNGEVRNSNFTNNTAKGLNLGTYNNTGDGGAIFWAGVNGTLTNDRFISNKAIKNINNNTSGRGGAMYAGSSEHGNRNITITGSYFKDNNAGTNGGALDWYYGARDGLVDDCTFCS